MAKNDVVRVARRLAFRAHFASNTYFDNAHNFVLLFEILWGFNVAFFFPRISLQFDRTTCALPHTKIRTAKLEMLMVLRWHDAHSHLYVMAL